MSDDKDQVAGQDGADVDAGLHITIPGDKVLQALGRLVDSGDIDQDGKASIWWFYGHVRDRAMTLGDAGKCIDRDGTTIHRLFNGRYGAKYDNLLSEIARYRRIAEERAKRRDIGYIETSTWRKIAAVCRGALYDNMPAYVYGSSQIGKTAALLEYQRRNNHGQTRYLRMPAAPTMPLVMGYLAEACYISTRLSQVDLRRRVMDALDDKTLLIVDEFHQALLNTSDLGARKIVEFIREVYDRTGCGVVICGTKVLQNELARGRQSMVWDQFKRRGMIELTLPDTPPKADIIKIAAAFGLPDPDQPTWETIREMLQASGVGKYIKFLQYAHGLSKTDGQPLSWEHFAKAYRSVIALSKGAA
jgi:DNA transposition AAA+ family ATPase